MHTSRSFARFPAVRMVVSTAIIAAALSVAGCSQSQDDRVAVTAPNGTRHWGIPLGEWRGRGAFVYECFRKPLAPGVKREPGKNDCQGIASVAREYSTSLKIVRTTLGGHEVVEFSILSERGEIPTLDKETRLRFALEPISAPRLQPGGEESLRLYRVAAAEFNPTNSRSDYKYESDAEPPTRASLMQRGGEVVLQVVYAENFVDTFRFRGAGVEKNGVFFSADPGMVHWVEHLTTK